MTYQNKKLASFLLISPILASACTTNLVSDRTDATKSNVGVVYYLPHAVVRSNVTIELQRCDYDPNTNKLTFELNYTGQISGEIVANPNESFALAYEDLSSAMKTTSVDLKLSESGLLESVNASANDRSAAVIGSVVDTVLTLKSIPFSLEKEDQTVAARAAQIEYCTLSAKAHMAMREQDKSKVSAAQKTYLEDLKNGKANVKSQTEKLVALKKKLADATAAEDKDKIAKLTKEVEAATKILAGLKSKLAKITGPKYPKELAARAKKIKEVLSHEFQHLAAPSGQGQQFNSFGAEHLDKVLAKWLTTAGRALLGGSEADLFDFRLYWFAPGTDTICASANNCISDGETGVYYRSTVSTRFLLCRTECLAEDNTIATALVLSEKMLPTPQYGVLGLLPLNNGAFEKNSIVAKFSASGALVGVTYTTEAAAAEELAKSLSGEAEKYAKFRKTKLDADQIEADNSRQAEIDQIDHEIELLEKKKELEDAKNGIFVDGESPPPDAAN